MEFDGSSSDGDSDAEGSEADGGAEYADYGNYDYIQAADPSRGEVALLEVEAEIEPIVAQSAGAVALGGIEIIGAIPEDSTEYQYEDVYETTNGEDQMDDVYATEAIPEDALITPEQLAAHAIAHQEADYEERLASDREPTEVERAVGRYLESFQPQVRNAAMMLYEKGASVETAGFDPENVSIQHIVGSFEIDDETESALAELGVSTTRHASATELSFEPMIMDLGMMQEDWDRIAELVPDSKGSGPVDYSYDAMQFRSSPPSQSFDNWNDFKPIRDGKDHVGM